jgi:manganese-dependent inorganic pyrophosphatase
MSEVLVIGHRNPDTDSICSAIGYAEFKRRTGLASAVAARCGDTNDRIDFVLKTFGVPAPRFVADVSPKVRDVMQTRVLSASPSTTAAEALGLMEERHIRTLPIVHEDRTCAGLVSVFKMSKFFFPTANRPVDSRRVLASLNQLVRTLKAEPLHLVEPDREEDLVLMIGAMNPRSFAERLEAYPRERILVVVGDREDIQWSAIKEKVRAVIVTGGLSVDERMVQDARQQGVAMLQSPHDTATTAMLCRTAMAAVQRLAADSQLSAFPVFDQQRRIVGILSKTDFLKKVDRQLILVDHNEISQAVQGADQVEIIEIIDHHRIGALTTSQPILFRNEPVGSTSTIVADCFFRHGVELPPPIAGLLLAGLVSDTLNLTSPTTTGRDAEVLKRLETIAGIDATDFTEKLFASGSVLIAKPASQAVRADSKDYRERGHKFSVAQIEEIGFDQFWKRKTEVMSALEDCRSRSGYHFSALLVTDVVMQTSLLLIAGPEAFLKKIDYPEREPGIYELAGVVSRKKQLLPYLTHCLERT